MSLKLNSSGGGSVTVQEPTTASNRTLNLPDADGTVVYADGSGNVGIGTSSPNSTLNVIGGQTTFDTNVFGQVLVRSTAAYNATPRAGIAFSVKYNSAGAYIAGGSSIQGYKQTAVDGEFANGLLFTTQAEGSAPTERARIDSSGNLLVGTTSAALDAVGARLLASNQIQASKSGDWSFRMGRTTSSGIIAEIYYNTSRVGDIATNGSNTTYNSASDYRLKENIVPMTGALEKILTLNPVTYNWKVDGSNGQGFIAHELQEVVPDAVRGVKDEIDENGNPVYQGIDTSFLVATLTAAIQEQQKMIETLQAKVAALEAK